MIKYYLKEEETLVLSELSIDEDYDILSEFDEDQFFVKYFLNWGEKKKHFELAHK